MVFQSITTNNNHVNVELLKEIEPNYKPKLYPITKSEYLCVIYSLLKICRKDLYNKLFSKELLDIPKEGGTLILGRQ